MSNFVVDVIRTVKIEQNRRRHDSKKGTVTTWAQLPIAEHIIDAIDAADARRRADRILATYIPHAADAVRVWISPDAAPIDCAADIAYDVLNTSYQRKCLDFIEQAMNSIAFHDMTADAADVVSEVAAGLFDADAAAAIAAQPKYDGAGDCPMFFRRRAAYAAANKYVRSWANRRMTTARRDISDYFRYISDADAADARAAADFGNSYLTPAAMPDADADTIAAAMSDRRAEYMRNRRIARRYIDRAFDCMTPRQRDCMIAYAAAGNMRTAAADVGLKSVATIAEHIARARRAINDAGIARAIIDTNTIGLRAAAADADARRANCIAAARMTAAADAARAAAMVTTAYEPTAARMTADAARMTADADAARAARARRDCIAAARAYIDAADEQTARAMLDAAADAARRAYAAAIVAAISDAAAIDAADAADEQTAAAIDARHNCTADADSAARMTADAARAELTARAAILDGKNADARAINNARRAEYADAIKPADAYIINNARAARRAAYAAADAAYAAAADDAMTIADADADAAARAINAAADARRAAYADADAAYNAARAAAIVTADSAARMTADAMPAARAAVYGLDAQTADRATHAARPTAARRAYDAAALDAARAAYDARRADADAEYAAARAAAIDARAAAIIDADAARDAIDAAADRRRAAYDAARAAYDADRRAAVK